MLICFVIAESNVDSIGKTQMYLGAVGLSCPGQSCIDGASAQSAHCMAQANIGVSTTLDFM
jgi:hypothetical protein